MMNPTDSSSMVALHMASLIRPLFGKSESVKCVVNEHDDTVLVKDASLLLQLLDIEHPVGQLIISVCSSHSHCHGTGVKSLLTMLGYLTEAYLTLHDMGIPGPVVVTLMRTVLEDCQEKLKEIQIPLSSCVLSPRHTQEHRCLTHETDSGYFEAKTLSNEAKEISGNSVVVPPKGTEFQDVPLSETKFVHLKMKAKDDMDGEGVDDIEWFFDRSGPEMKDEEKLTAEAVRENLIQRNRMEKSDLICSLKDADQHDSDFDDCFDKGPTKRNIRLLVDSNETPVVSKSSLADQFQGSKCSEQEAASVRAPLFGNDTADAKKNEALIQDDDDMTDDLNDLDSDVKICHHPESPDVIKDDFDSCFDDLDQEDKILSNKAEVKIQKTDQKVWNTKRFEECLKLSKNTVRTVNRPNVCLSSRNLKCDTTFQIFGNSEPAHCVNQIPDTSRSSVALAKGIKQRKIDISQGDSEKSEVSDEGSEIGKLNKMLFEVQKKKKALVSGSDKSSEHSQFETYTSEVEPRNSTMSIQELNNMLELVDQKKNRVLSQESLLNSSRHFKTFETSIAVMNENKISEANSSKASHFEQRLQERLAEKKHQTVQSSLSHSRHFKSFDDVTISGVNLDLKISDTVNQHSVHSAVEGYSMQSVSSPDMRDHGNQNLGQRKSSKRASDSKCHQKENDDDDDDDDAQFPTMQSLSLQDAAQGLSHGCEAVMELVLQAAETQMLKTEQNQFNIKLVHTCTVAGPSTKHTAIVPGLVLDCDIDVVSSVTSHSGKHWNTMLINGDLSQNYHHHGYKDATKGNLVIGPDCLAISGSKELWIHNCQQHLQRLSVDLILVRGQTEAKVKDTLQSVGILTIESVPFQLLEAVRESTGTELTVYVTDSTKIHVCEGMTFQPYDVAWCDKMTIGSKQKTLVIMDTQKPSVFQTFVLCHPSSHALDVQEQEVQACSKRLSIAMHDGLVLPGGGLSEMFCCQYILEKSCAKREVINDLDLYRPVVMETLAEVFNKISSLVKTSCPCSQKKCSQQPVSSETTPKHSRKTSDITKTMADEDTSSVPPFLAWQSNSNNVSPSGFVIRHDMPVFDNYKSKMAAWSAAMDTVAMVTQTDAHVVTGVTSDAGNNTGMFVKGVIL